MPKGSAFWDDRYDAPGFAYGTDPNAFVAQAVDAWLPPPTPDAPVTILDLGAGEGRNALYLARQGYAVTAADFSAAGLAKTRTWAEDAGVDVETQLVDVRTWSPERTWDGVVTTFLHLGPSDRPRLYRLLQRLVRPGGRVVAEWFRPEQRTEGYESGGPPDVQMMVTAGELRTHFPEAGRLHLELATPHLDEGPHHRGPAATIRLVWEKPGADDGSASADATDERLTLQTARESGR